MMGANFIPSGMSIGCGKGKRPCSWWPFSDTKTLQDESVQETAASTTIAPDTDALVIPDRVRRLLEVQSLVKTRQLLGEKRRLLGGFSAIVKFANKAAKAIKDAANVALKSLNSLSLSGILKRVKRKVVDPVIAPFIKLGNAAKDLANKAVEPINKVVKLTVDIANKIANVPQMIWNSVYSIIPTKFEMTTVSMFDVTGVNERDMKCDQHNYVSQPRERRLMLCVAGGHCVFQKHRLRV
jgi:hypothetical protein